jgi:hypothetical protein
MRRYLVSTLMAALTACATPGPRVAPPLEEDEVTRLRLAVLTYVTSLSARAHAAASGLPAPSPAGPTTSSGTDDDEVWLWSRDTLERLASRIDGTDPGDERRALEYLHRFLAAEHLRRVGAPLDARITALLAAPVSSTDGRTVAELRTRLAASPDPAERKSLAQLLAPHSKEIAAVIAQRRATEVRLLRDLDLPPATILGFRRRGDERAVALRARNLLASSRALLDAALDTRRFDADLAQPFSGFDFPRLLGLDVGGDVFNAEALVARAGKTLEGMGIPITELPIQIDAEPRPDKRSGAATFALKVPGDVRVTILPRGGLNDDVALLHALGQALLMSTSRTSVFELALLGDGALVGAHGFVLESVAGEPSWLAAQGLDPEEADRLAERYHLSRLLVARRGAAQVLVAVEAFGASAAKTREVAREHFSEAFGVALDDTMLDLELSDAAPATAALHSLDGLLLGSALAELLDQRCGAPFWTKREAGAFLRELWRDGQRESALELAERVLGAWPDELPLLRRTARAFASPVAIAGAP